MDSEHLVKRDRVEERGAVAGINHPRPSVELHDVHLMPAPPVDPGEHDVGVVLELGQQPMDHPGDLQSRRRRLPVRRSQDASRWSKSSAGTSPLSLACPAKQRLDAAERHPLDVGTGDLPSASRLAALAFDPQHREVTIGPGSGQRCRDRLARTVMVSPVSGDYAITPNASTTCMPARRLLRAAGRLVYTKKEELRSLECLTHYRQSGMSAFRVGAVC